MKDKRKVWFVRVSDTTPGWGLDASFYVVAPKKPTRQQVLSKEDWSRTLRNTDLRDNDRLLHVEMVELSAAEALSVQTDDVFTVDPDGGLSCFYEVDGTPARD